MSEGPTTVGSIDAKVGMTLDQWRADVAYLKASAAEIGAIRPEITVDANTTRAQEQMAAVDAAAVAMGVSATTSAAQIDAAAATVSAAEGRSQTAAEKAAAATKALGEAEQSAARSATEEAAAETAKAAAVDQGAQSTNRSVGYMQLVIGAIAAVIALGAPLSAAAIGIGGAFAGMGAAGVLAVLGVVAAMKQGTEVGQQYSVGVQTLKGDLDSLGNTAAVGLLSSFRAGVNAINGDMPELNAEVGTFAHQLGGAAVTGLQGVINLFRVGNPLFVEGAQVVQNIASGFKQWTEDGGLQKFADYAVTELPIVVQTLGDLGSAVVRIVEAFAPFGNVVLDAVTAVSSVINVIPTPVLTETAILAVGVVAAFKGWQAISPIVDKASASVQQMGAQTITAKVGAVGLAGSIITASLAVDQFALSAMKAGSSGIRDLFRQTRSVQQWSDAVDKGNININHLDNLLAASSGFWNDLTRNIDMTGTSTQTLSASELPKLDQAMAKASPAKMTAAWAQLTAEAKKQGVSQDDLAAKFPITSAAIDAQKQALDGATTSTDANTQSSAAAAQAYLNASSTAQQWATQLDSLVTAMNTANGIGQSAVATNAAYQDALAKVKDTVDKAKQGVQGYSTSIDQSTQAGADNASMFAQLAQQSQAAAKAQFDVDHNAQNYQATLNAGKQALVDQITSLTGNAQAAKDLADKIYAIPDQKTITMLDNASTVQTNVDNLNKAIANLTDRKTITIVEEFQQVLSQVSASREQQQHSGPGQAFGGTIGHLAGGGSVNGPGSSQSDTAGLFALSNGEEVTSNYFGQASKYRSLLKMINAGAPAGQIAGKAMSIAGTAPPVAVTAGGPAVVHNHTWYVQSNNGEQLYQDVMRKTNAKVGP